MDQQTQFDSLRLVGRISIWFAVVALLGLMAVIILFNVSEGGYLETVQALALTRDRLPVIMLSGGLVLALGTGLTTWIITLYSSFRVAGPLFRFARNLETGIQSGKVPAIRIRDTDALQQECDQLHRTTQQLYNYYRTIDAQAVAALSALQNGDNDQAEAALAELKLQQGRVLYDGRITPIP